MPNEPDNPKFMAVCWVACCAFLALGGCQRRAYTDIYAESMAGEIRELEDRIYEYDAAYQGLEDELAVLQSENHRLQDRIMTLQSEPANSTNSNRTLFKGLPGSRSSTQVIPKPDPSSDAASRDAVKSPKESKTPSVDQLPAPAEPGRTKKTEPDSIDAIQDLQPPKIEMGIPSKSILPPGGELIPKGLSPTVPSADGLLPPPIPDSSSPSPNSGTEYRSLHDRSKQLASHQNSSLESPPGEPESMPTQAIAVEALPKNIDEDAVQAGKIDLPPSVQSATYLHSTSSTNHPGARDTKVIEIAFHPTLCRGQFLDTQDKEDGISLVLQPRNAAGETLDIPASLTIVVLDPNRPEHQSKIGRWTFTQEQVEAQLEPVGIGHGFHIPIQWQEAKPAGDAVQVFVRYEMADGRRLVNERRIQLHVPSAGSAAWTPRVAK